MARQVHIRYEGQSLDVDLDGLDVGDLSSDADIRQAIATHLNAPLAKLQNFQIDRNNDTGDLTLRPQAVFG